MTLRAELSGTQRITFTQQFNVENRLVAVTNTVSGQVTQFTYDGDGARVLEVSSAITTAYVGGHYEKVSNVVTPTKYYALGGKRVATRNASGLFYLHGDHLGSSSLTTSNTGTLVAQLRYLPFGGTRWESGNTPTDFQFTGQRKESGFGLYDYNARYYDPLIGRFVSADSVVPGAGNPQTLNRYSYVNNNPLKYIDPSGHECTKPDGSACVQETIATDEPTTYYLLVPGLYTQFDVEPPIYDHLAYSNVPPLNDIQSALGPTASYVPGYNNGNGVGEANEEATRIVKSISSLSASDRHTNFVLIGHSRGGGDVFSAYGQKDMEPYQYKIKAIIGLEPNIRENVPGGWFGLGGQDWGPGGAEAPRVQAAHDRGIPILIIAANENNLNALYLNDKNFDYKANVAYASANMSGGGPSLHTNLASTSKTATQLTVDFAHNPKWAPGPYSK